MSSHSHHEHGGGGVHSHSHDHHGHEPLIEEQEEEESDYFHLVKVLSAFAFYKRHALNHNYRKRRDYHSLPEHHKRLVPELLSKIDKVDQCIEENMNFLRAIIQNSSMFLDQPMTQLLQKKNNSNQPPVSPMDMDKVKSTFKQFVRDWSKEGEAERMLTYDPIIQELNEIYKDMPMEKRAAVRVLVPGAGLGRLAFDIAKSGFSCQGNEFSYYMLFASHFILNRMKEENAYKIYPFVHSFSNIKSDEHQLTPVLVPDTVPGNLLPEVDFSMVAGDFIEVYGAEAAKDNWDVVVTCFFMDTAKNIIEYMEVIRNTLKQGGTWINIGPLLYHFEDSSAGDTSIELSLESVKRVAQELGFEFKKESMVSTTYTSNPDGMLKYVYDCAFWTAVKR